MGPTDEAATLPSDDEEAVTVPSGVPNMSEEEPQISEMASYRGARVDDDVADPDGARRVQFQIGKDNFWINHRQ